MERESEAITAMKQIIVDIQEKNNDWKSVVGEIHITDDVDGRLYIETNGISFGVNLTDIMDFIRDQMLRK